MKRIVIIATTLLLFLNASAQLSEIRGFVYDKETGEPVIFCNVFLEGTPSGATTDMNGFYDLSRIKPGTYRLAVNCIGYDSVRMEIVLEKGQIINKNFTLNSKALNLSEIVITDKKVEDQTQVKISKIKITPIEMAKLPSIGGTPDLAQYIQILPGIITSGDKGGQIYIRGGTPIQNRVLMDGMTIYNPFHSIGLFSVFDVDIIKSIDVYAGGFDAEYGDRISAVMDIQTIDGNKKKLTGKAGISPFTSKFILHGPIKKWEADNNFSTFLFSTRTSYLNKTAPVLYSYADKNGLPYSFTDLFGKVSMNASDGSKIEFFGFSFNDLVNFKGITKYDWTSNGGGMQFMLIPSSSPTIVEGHFSYSDYRIEQREADNKPRFSLISGFESGMKFSYYIGKDLLRYGFDLYGFKTQFEYYNDVGRHVTQTDNTTNIGGYMKYKKIAGKFIFLPSLRMQYYASLQETSFEPRFGFKYKISKNIRYKLATGIYSQNFISAFSDRDVVNHFYGFLSAPDDIPRYFDGKRVTTRLQKARHYISGFEFDFKKNNSINIEAYYKDYNQLTNINRNKIFDDIPEFNDKPEYLKSDYIIETGDAYGFDFLYTYDKRPLYLWVVYDLAFVTRYDGFTEYVPNWDRRHNIQLLASYIFGDLNPLEFSARWNYGSSFPFTQTQGFYEYLSFSDGINQDYTTVNGDLGILYAAINQGRLPQFHRLDMSLKKTYHFKDKTILEATFSVSNVYNRNNIFYYDRVKSTRIDQLPVLPSFGATYSF